MTIATASSSPGGHYHTQKHATWDGAKAFRVFRNLLHTGGVNETMSSLELKYKLRRLSQIK